LDIRPGHAVRFSAARGRASDEEETMSGEQGADSKQQIVVVGTVSAGARAGGKRDVVERAVDITKIRASFERFLDGLKGVIDVKVPAVGPFELEEVSFAAELSADGEFKLLGTGVGVEAKAGVHFILRRKK
jgi:hypothetical protein